MCYVSCILRHFQCCGDTYRQIAECIESLVSNCKVKGDGTVWEKIVRIAILLKFVTSAKRGWEMPFKFCLVSEARGADIEFKRLGEYVHTVEEARNEIYNLKEQFPFNTLVLFVPINTTQQHFSGFCVRYEGKEVKNICGFQCKDGDQEADGVVPAWLIGGGYLLRSDPPSMFWTPGFNEKGWKYYGKCDTDHFIGWSLNIFRN